jgi:N-acetylmuramoyl-L-alanine amidase
MIRQGAKGHPVHEVVIHCSATRPLWMHNAPLSEKVAEVRRWHVQERGWRDIGYHRIIDRDGRIAVGRSLWEIGAHTVGRNSGTVGVCLLGGHGSSANDRFDDHFTPAQRASLEAYLRELAELTELKRISGHNEFAAKACPGFNVREEFNLRKILGGRA